MLILIEQDQSHVILLEFIIIIEILARDYWFYQVQKRTQHFLSNLLMRRNSAFS